MTEGNFEEGHPYADEAIRLNPGVLGPEWTKAFGFLMAGDYEIGFPAWECRLKLLKIDKPSIPMWKGESLKGKTLITYGEQGLGDVLQFVRFLKCLPPDTGNILFETPIELRPLLEYSLSQWNLNIPFSFRNHGSTIPCVADYQISLLSLPSVVNGFPTDPYLHAPPANISGSTPGQRLKVGICWAGNPTHKFDRERSSSLGEFLVELSVPELELFSLQVGPENRKDDPSLIGEGGFVHDIAKQFKSFADTATAIQSMDYIVTVDTSVAHLAGALGKNTCLLLPHRGLDWRWGLNSTATRWYPNTKLFRKSPDDQNWLNALNQVAKYLAKRS